MRQNVGVAVAAVVGVQNFDCEAESNIGAGKQYYFLGGVPG